MGKFVDEVGAIRHAMSDKELNELYKRLENFIADCTVEEAKEIHYSSSRLTCS